MELWSASQVSAATHSPPRFVAGVPAHNYPSGRTPTGPYGLGLHEVVEAAPGPPPDAVPQQRRPTEQQPRRPERLARPAVEAELVAMLGDQAVAEAESGPHVVVHVAAGLRERVVRQPPRRPGLVAGLVLEQLDAQVARPAREHPPHRARLRSP